MIVEEVFDKQHTPSPQRRPYGHLKKGTTKNGNKRRSLRTRLVSLLDEEDGSDDEDYEDDLPVGGGRPPAITVAWLGVKGLAHE
jgi:hypothetical protein